MDLKQEAALWLCKCAQRFDPARGVKWSTYAYRSVYLRIKRLHDIRRINEAKRYDYECKTAEVGFSIEDGSAARIMCEKSRNYAMSKNYPFFVIGMRATRGTK